MDAGESETGRSTFGTQGPRGTAARQRWREPVILTALIPLLGIACGASDPFGLRAEVPWLALIPLLIGVQHGLAPALASAGVLCAGAWAHASWLDLPLPPAAVSFAAAGIVSAASAGLGRDGTEQRQAQALRELHALTTQVELQQRAYHVLERSHEELVERLACEPTCLQSLLNDARRELARLHDWPALGGVLLRVLGQHAGVQAAVLHALSVRTGQLEPAPAARLGGAACELERGQDPARIVRSPLVERALRSRRLVSWVDLAGADSAVLAAVPLLTSSGELLGVIAIRELPFTSFAERPLQDLFALALALTDPIAAQLSAARPRDELAPVRLQAAPPPEATPPAGATVAALRARLRASYGGVTSRATPARIANPLASTRPSFVSPAGDRARQLPPPISVHSGSDAAEADATTDERSASGPRSWGPVG